MFDAEQKLGTHQHGREGHFDAGLEAARRLRLPVQIQRALQIGMSDGAPIGSPHQRLKDPFGTGAFLVAIRRVRHENPPPARRIAWTGRRVGADDRNRIDGWLDPWMSIGIEVCLIGLARGFEQIRSLLQKRDADGMRTGGHPYARLQLPVDRVV